MIGFEDYDLPRIWDLIKDSICSDNCTPWGLRRVPYNDNFEEVARLHKQKEELYYNKTIIIKTAGSIEEALEILAGTVPIYYHISCACGVESSDMPRHMFTKNSVLCIHHKMPSSYSSLLLPGVNYIIPL